VSLIVSIAGMLRFTQPWVSLLKFERAAFDTLGEDHRLRSR